MKKRVLAMLLALAMIFQMMPTTAMAAGYQTPSYGAQDAVAKFEDGTPMSVAHRAAWRNGPECSLIAIAAAINMGIDVAELDVKLTKDGVAVLSHDETINRCTTSTGKVSDYTWEELKTIPVEDGQGGTNVAYTLTEADVALLKQLPHYVEHCGEPEVGGTMPLTRLDDALDLIQLLGADTMVNWDHCFYEDRFVASYIEFREAGMLDNVFFKNSVTASTMNTWYAAAAAAWNELYPEDALSAADVQKSILYVYINHSEDYSALQSHLDNGDNLVMVEICIGDDAADAAIHEKLEPWCLEKGVKMFVNTMWSGLCSTKEDSETTWAEMLDRGYAAIQTDQPSELSSYMAAYNSERSATSQIQAEHFHMFNYEDYGLYVPESCDTNLNKKVEGIESGDYMEYRNIVFDGTEVMLNLNVKVHTGSILNVYLDSMEASDRIAQVNLSANSDYQTVTAALDSAIAAGTHTVYLQVSGVAETDLVSMDYFQFVSSGDFSGEAAIADVKVTTMAGTAPVLPGTVEVTVNGITYGLEVRWEQVAAENYAEAGKEFTVLGYVAVLGKYIEATVTVEGETEIESGITEDGLVLWLDASEGVTVENNAVTAWASKVGNITVTQRKGSPTLVSNAAGTQAGIRFDGNDAMDIVMEEDFWNGKSEFTVLMYTAAEMNTSGSTSGTASQYNSVMYFPETASWGSLYFTASQNEIIWRFGSGSSGDYGTTYVRSANIGSMYTSTAIRKDGKQDTVFVDGEEIYSGYAVSDVTKSIDYAGYIGVGKSSNYYKGTICEILIYDRALTDEEILAAQAALAAKYADPIKNVEEVNVTTAAGTAPTLPSTVQVTYQSGNAIAMGVTWEAINPTYYVSAGEFTVKGTLVNGDTITANVTVKETAQTEKSFATDGLMIWLNSSHGISTDENGKVLTWNSKVGSYYATSTITGDATIDGMTYVAPSEEKNNITVQEDAVNGKPAVVFDGDGDMLQMVVASGAFNDLTEATIIVYGASKTPVDTAGKGDLKQNVQCHTLFMANETGGWGSMYAGIYTDAIGSRIGNGTSKNYGFYQMRDKATTDYSATVIRWEGGLYDVDVDGEDFDVTTTAYTAASKRIDSILWIGAGKPNNKAADTTAPTYWTGSVCEILIYDRALTDEELEEVYAYLEDTYNPKEVDTDGLMFWLDASEGVTTDENGNVTQWASKAGIEGAAAVYKKGDTSLKTNAVNGKSAVSFDGNEDVLMMTLEDGAFDGLEAMTVIAYAASNTAVNTGDLNYYGQRNTLFTVDETSAGWGAVYTGIYTNAISARFGTGVSQDRGFVAERSENMTGYSTTVVRWDGSTLAYDIDVDGEDFGTGASKGSTTGHNKNIVYLGTGKENTYWTGDLCELLVFSRALSDEELEVIYDYLDEKYTEKAPETKSVTGIYLKESAQQLTMYTDDTEGIQLTAYTVPANADNTGLIYTTSNPEVAVVDENGKVTAVGYGYAVITVTTADGGYSAYCNIFVDHTDSEKIWQNIQDILTWAEAQDEEDYWNWEDTLGAAIAAFEESGLTEDSAAADLQAAYEALREAMRELLEPVSYAYTEESKDQMVKAGEALTVEILPDSEYLYSVLVDGYSVDPENYTVTSAYENSYIRSTSGMIITLNEEYMSTLAVGTAHTLTVMFVNGEEDLTTSFTIAKTEYQVAAGSQNQIITAGKALTLNITPDGTQLIEVQIDGKAISADQYQATHAADGSGLTITLKAEYVKALSLGTHEIKVVFADGEAVTGFATIKASSGTQTNTGSQNTSGNSGSSTATTTTTSTGDTNSPVMLMALVILSGGVVLYLALQKKKRVG